MTQSVFIFSFFTDATEQFEPVLNVIRNELVQIRKSSRFLLLFLFFLFLLLFCPEIMKWTILIVVLIFAIAFVKSENELEKPLIDSVTLEYQSVEQQLWSAINNHADSQTVYARIVDAHEIFFASDFGETITLRHLYVPLSQALIDNLQRLNGTFQSARNVLRLSRNDSVLAEDAIGAFGRDYLISSVKSSDNIFNEVSRAQFWNKGKNVC